MIRRILLPALLALSSLAGATAVKEYAVRLRVQPDGTATGTAVLSLTGCVPGNVDVPIGLQGFQNLKVSKGPSGSEAEAVHHGGGQPHLHILLPAGVEEKATVELSFDLPQAFSYTEAGKGSGITRTRFLKHAFVNTQEAEIGEYRFEALLPPGTMVQAIREQLPKQGKTEAEPRVRLGKIDGCQSATLQYKKIKQGDDTSMSLEIADSRKSLVWLFAGVVLAALYLVYFRGDYFPSKPA
jgi:hypothetical protein